MKYQNYCVYPLDQQIKLFESIRPLFSNKQIMVVANKTDVVPYDSLSSSAKAAIENMAKSECRQDITTYFIIRMIYNSLIMIIHTYIHTYKHIT